MKYIDADKLKAEIDKRYAEYRAKMKTDDFTYYEGMADALDLFEQFLDSISEQPVEKKSNALFDKCVENCDPAVMKEVSDNVDKMMLEEEIREYMSNEDNNPFDWDWRDKRDCARHFAGWGAEHLKR